MHLKVITKWGQSLLQSGVEFITKWGSFFITKWGKIYYKVGQDLLQSGAVITKCGNFITKWGSYHKVWQLLQSGA